MIGLSKRMICLACWMMPPHACINTHPLYDLAANKSKLLDPASAPSPVILSSCEFSRFLFFGEG